MKTILYIFMAVSILSISLSAAGAYGEEEVFPNTPKESLYSYSEDDTPEVFFFPKEKARWDGSKVTMKEWYTLTDLQKERFINEYVGELQRQYNQSIEVAGLEYMKALNVFSNYSNGKGIDEPSTKFIDRLLDGEGKVFQKSSR